MIYCLEIIETKLWGWRIWQSPAHFISSPRPMPRRKKFPMTNKGNPNCQDILPRMTLSSADQNHRRGRHQITRSSPLEDPKGDSRDTRSVPWVGKETLGPIGEWWRDNPRKSRHLRIKYPQLIPWPHWCGCDPWTVRWGPQQLTERQKEWPMGHALEYGHGWLTSVGGGWTEERDI